VTAPRSADPSDSPTSDGVEEEGTRAGYVTLVGTPNAGKSTLLNAFVGEKLSIVTPKAQTTWRRVTGIWSSERTQMIFLDTPGLLAPQSLLQRSMLGSALEAVREADVLLLLVDASRPPDPESKERILHALEDGRAPVVAAVNKIDIADETHAEDWDAWARERMEAETHRVSALHGTGLDRLREAIDKALPPSPFLYPADQIASESVRFFAAELVRETVFELYREEIPYSVWCRVEEFRESQEPTYIQVNLFVERPSQKRILIGKGGGAIRELGATSRGKIEAFLESRVYLDLWVKVRPKWRRRRRDLEGFGFPVSEEAKKER